MNMKHAGAFRVEATAMGKISPGVDMVLIWLGWVSLVMLGAHAPSWAVLGKGKAGTEMPAVLSFPSCWHTSL